MSRRSRASVISLLRPPPPESGDEGLGFESRFLGFRVWGFRAWGLGLGFGAFRV